MLRKMLITLAIVAIAAVLVGSPVAEREAAAQSTQYVYSANFVCGWNTELNGRTEADELRYENSTKIANYAFKFDFTNPQSVAANLTGDVHLLEQNNAPPPGRWPASAGGSALPATVVPAGNALTIDCIEIAEALFGAAPAGLFPYISG